MIGLVHLVWAPLGREPLRRFLRSYHDHAAGAEHELTIVLNGAPPGTAVSSTRESLLAELKGTDHQLIVLERAVLDLSAYGEAARRIEHPRLCFLNSYSVILADGWLGCLARALDASDVGLAGASASWESQAEWLRGKARYWPYQLLGLPRSRGDYPRFPNPHVRTTAFIAGRDTILDLGLEQVHDKRSAYLLESGALSITRRVQESGLRAVVAGRDGRIYDVEEWPRSNSYRSGGQENLLVADNRTLEWERASPRLRRRLTRDAWGGAGVVWKDLT